MGFLETKMLNVCVRKAHTAKLVTFYVRSIKTRFVVGMVIANLSILMQAGLFSMSKDASGNLQKRQRLRRIKSKMALVLMELGVWHGVSAIRKVVSTEQMTVAVLRALVLVGEVMVEDEMSVEVD